MIRTSAPFRVIIAGEWAVLEPTSKGIVAALTPRYFCEIESNPQNEIEISLNDFNLNGITARYENNELIFNQPLSDDVTDKLKLIKFLIESALFHMNYFKPFKIRTWSDKLVGFSSSLELKLSLGSSAAAVVAILSAIYSLYKVPLQDKKERERLFKLCLLSDFIIQDMKGSGIDVAASFYGGILQYKRFDRNWVLKNINRNLPIDVFIEYKWPNLNVKSIKNIPDLQLLVGWTQIPAPTTQLISRMNTFKAQNYSFYYEIILQMAKLVKDLAKALKKGNKSRILADIKINQTYLRKLSEISGISIAIPELQLLAHIADKNGGAGKISGAGGGDCGIAICFDEISSNKIIEEWEKNNIIGSPVKIDQKGVQIEVTDSKNSE